MDVCINICRKGRWRRFWVFLEEEEALLLLFVLVLWPRWELVSPFVSVSLVLELPLLLLPISLSSLKVLLT